MKKYVVDESFINGNKKLVKELCLKVGDVIGFDSAEAKTESIQGDPIKEDPRKPPVND